MFEKQVVTSNRFSSSIHFDINSYKFEDWYLPKDCMFVELHPLWTAHDLPNQQKKHPLRSKMLFPPTPGSLVWYRFPSASSVNIITRSRSLFYFIFQTLGTASLGFFLKKNFHLNDLIHMIIFWCVSCVIF